jgi:DDE family transposase
VRAWKTELARLAAETGLAITACHLPRGTSKWNRIEHRLFSVISMNLAWPPATSHEVVVELIGATTAHTGLRVRDGAGPRPLPARVKVGDEELAAVPLARHEFHGEWNYTVRPDSSQQRYRHPDRDADRLSGRKRSTILDLRGAGRRSDGYRCDGMVAC